VDVTYKLCYKSCVCDADKTSYSFLYENKYQYTTEKFKHILCPLDNVQRIDLLPKLEIIETFAPFVSPRTCSYFHSLVCRKTTIVTICLISSEIFLLHTSN
jgi:hypothetical protein